MIQINPTAVDSLPKTNSQIFDRRNQMEGNVRCMQSLEFVESCNFLLREKAVNFDVLARFGFTRREPISVRFVRCLPNSVHPGLCQQASREPSQIHRLIEDGEQQGWKFLESLATSGPGRLITDRAGWGRRPEKKALG